VLRGHAGRNFRLVFGNAAHRQRGGKLLKELPRFSENPRLPDNRGFFIGEIKWWPCGKGAEKKSK
jgi:hypothetical protein